MLHTSKYQYIQDRILKYKAFKQKIDVHPPSFRLYNVIKANHVAKNRRGAQEPRVVSMTKGPQFEPKNSKGISTQGKTWALCREGVQTPSSTMGISLT